MSRGKIVKSGYYLFEGIGTVRIEIRCNSKRLIARWRSGMLRVTAPWGIEYEGVQKFLNDYSTRLQQTKPKTPYYDGQIIKFEEFSIEIKREARLGDKMVLNMKESEGVIGIGQSWDMEAPGTIRQITKFICRIAQSLAEGALLPFAHQVADEIGKHPMAWSISNGHRILGHCNSNGEIALSYALLFYPSHLRRYVVCHELAHLTEMNHSARFRTICDAYCNGHMEELDAELKNQILPIPRI